MSRRVATPPALRSKFVPRKDCASLSATNCRRTTDPNRVCSATNPARLITSPLDPKIPRRRDAGILLRRLAAPTTPTMSRTRRLARRTLRLARLSRCIPRQESVDGAARPRSSEPKSGCPYQPEIRRMRNIAAPGGASSRGLPEPAPTRVTVSAGQTPESAMSSRWIISVRPGVPRISAMSREFRPRIRSACSAS